MLYKKDSERLLVCLLTYQYILFYNTNIRNSTINEKRGADMGDISIIARRLANGQVEYGYSGNGGYSFFETHMLTNRPFWIGESEREIFSKIAFIDYGYFYDLDDKWYYVVPGPFKIKIPFELIVHALENAEYEFDFCNDVQKKIVEYMFTSYKDSNSDFQCFLKENNLEAEDILNELICDSSDAIYDLFDKYKKVFSYFDDWILIMSDDKNENVGEIILKKKETMHIETIEWIKEDSVELHTEGELEVIKKFQNAIDSEVFDFVKAVYQGDTPAPITVGFLTDQAAEEIEKLTGKSVYGNRIVLDDNGAMHIRNRHGEGGEQDESMANIENIARMGYVLANYDDIEFHNEYAAGYVDANGKLAPKIIISKKIDGTYYVVEAVSDAKKHRNYIVSAYIGSK